MKILNTVVVSSDVLRLEAKRPWFGNKQYIRIHFTWESKYYKNNPSYMDTDLASREEVAAILEKFNEVSIRR